MRKKHIVGRKKKKSVQTRVVFLQNLLFFPYFRLYLCPFLPNPTLVGYTNILLCHNNFLKEEKEMNKLSKHSLLSKRTGGRGDSSYFSSFFIFHSSFVMRFIHWSQNRRFPTNQRRGRLVSRRQTDNNRRPRLMGRKPTKRHKPLF